MTLSTIEDRSTAVDAAKEGRAGGQIRPFSAHQARVAERIARGQLAGSTIAEIAKAVEKSERTVRRLRRHPDFAAAVERARAGMRADALREAEQGRLEAFKAARKVLREYDAGGAVGANEAMLAARVILSASQPPSEAQRERAKAQILAALPADLRTKVLETIDTGDARRLAAMSDEELRAIAGGIEGEL